jgi:hypothetical protein
MSMIDASGLGARRLARAQSRWRDAARLVSMRWEVLLAGGGRGARRPSRPTPPRSTPKRPQQRR